MVNNLTIDYVIRWLENERQRFQQQLASYESSAKQTSDSIPCAWPLEYLNSDYEDRLRAQIDDLSAIIAKQDAMAD